MGRLHHPLEGRDVTGQDAVDGAAVVSGEAALGSRHCCAILTRVLLVHVVLGDVNAEELNPADSLYCSPVDVDRTVFP